MGNFTRIKCFYQSSLLLILFKSKYLGKKTYILWQKGMSAFEDPHLDERICLGGGGLKKRDGEKSDHQLVLTLIATLKESNYYHQCN